jgi:DNA polymerase elongation subunit (family B)
MADAIPVRMCLLDLNYVMESGRPVMRLWGKAEDGRSVCVLDRGFLPYFYVEPQPEADAEKLARELGGIELDGQKARSLGWVERSAFGVPKKLLKLSFLAPPSVARFREVLKERRDIRESFEHGLPFYRRYLVDRGFLPSSWLSVTGTPVERGGLRAGLVLEAESIAPAGGMACPELKLMALDIECVEEDGEERIVMASLCDSAGFRKAFTYGKGSPSKGMAVLPDEQGMLEAFIRAVQERDPDVLLGYNSDRYDFIRLQERCEALGVPFVLGREPSEVGFMRRGWIYAASVKGRPHIDLYDFIENVLRPSLSSEALTLDSVAREMLGEGKEPMAWEDIRKEWESGDIDHLAAYCLRDSEVTLKLGERLLPQIMEMSLVVGQTAFDVSRMSYSQLVEWLLIRKAFRAGELIPNVPPRDEVQRRRKAPPYAGGYVHRPLEGVHDNIALFDFQSLYPSITITHNISPETLDCRCCAGDARAKVPGEDYHFCRRRKGFIPSVMEDLVRKRAEVKGGVSGEGQGPAERKALDNRQRALKILANAIYGYYAYPGSRWYSRVCAQSIASWGRFYIRGVIAKAEAAGLPVIYGDTDSLFLKVKHRKDASEFLGAVNRNLPGVMELDLQGIYPSGIFVLSRSGAAAKKRYALLQQDGSVLIRGFERVRRDWAAIARDTQEKVILAVLRDRSAAGAAEIVRGMVRLVREGRASMEDVAIRSQVTRPLEDYQQVGPHVAAARLAVSKGMRVPAGSTIRYVIAPGEGPISSRAVPLEYATAYDPEYYVNNQVVPAALRVLSGFGYGKEDLAGGEGQASLKGFLGK